MIVLNLLGQMKCTEAGCQKVLPVQMCLLSTGGFGFLPLRPEAKEWQVLVPGANPMGPMLCRCPEHRKTQPIIQPAIDMPPDLLKGP